MRCTQFFGAVALAATLFSCGHSAIADQEGSDIDTFGDWGVRCQRLPGALPCDLVHTIVNQATGAQVLSISIAYSPDADQYAAQFTIPLGVNLRRGVDIAVGDVLAQGVTPSRCELSGCYVEALVADDMRAALETSSAGSVTFSQDGENDIEIAFSLNGFIEATDALKAE